MKPHHATDIEIILPRAALDVVFDECDRYEHDETGGRLVGEYKEQGGKLIITVQGVIEPGPKARRSPVMLFQDGEYQEKVFRKIEMEQQAIEHLGTWHTHHVNGLQTLSGGDISTYGRTVNHLSQNTNFFYALLVVGKNESSHPSERYSFKHFVFRRGDDKFYEVSSRHVEIVDSPLLWPQQSGGEAQSVDKPTFSAAKAACDYSHHSHSHHSHYYHDAYTSRMERVHDKEIISEFYKDIKPFTSAKLGFYWRGPIELIDGTKQEVVLVEDWSSRKLSYSLILRSAPASLSQLADRLTKQEFHSARIALLSAERLCNRLIFEGGNKTQSNAEKIP